MYFNAFDSNKLSKAFRILVVCVCVCVSTCLIKFVSMISYRVLAGILLNLQLRHT